MFWNFNHFVVLEGFGGGKVYLNDPGQGAARGHARGARRSYSGVVLTFEPGPEFKKGGHAPSMLPRAAARAWRVASSR